MGVHDLLPFLRLRAPQAFQTLEAWRGSQTEPICVAVDAPIFMYKYAYAAGTGRRLTARMLLFAQELQARGLTPVFVFDGAALPQKEAEKERRREAGNRQSALQELQRSVWVTIGGEQVAVERSACPSLRPIREDLEATQLALREAGVRVEAA